MSPASFQQELIDLADSEIQTLKCNVNQDVVVVVSGAVFFSFWLLKIVSAYFDCIYEPAVESN